MNRGDILPFQKTRAGRPAREMQIERPSLLREATFRMVARRGRELTEQTAIAEREGDIRKVEQLLREKDHLHRLRKELFDDWR